MRIAVGGDHLGLPLKETVLEHLREKGLEVVDLGVNSVDPVDYPDIGTTVAKAVVSGGYDRGILFCGTGAGMAITANKVPGVRAVCVTDPYTAERAMASNNAQVITMGARVTGPDVATMLVDIWLEATFNVNRSGRKVAKIDALDGVRTNSAGSAVE